jgi:hypothetical protein
MLTWLCPVAVIVRLPLPILERDVLKTKALFLSFGERGRAVSSVFHGKFFRCSQVTANLTGAKRVLREIHFPNMGSGDVSFVTTFPALIVVAFPN